MIRLYIRYCVQILSIASLVISAIPLHSQPYNVNALSSRQLKIFGKTADKFGDVYSAIDYYSKYCELKDENLNLDYAFTLAELYKKARDYKTAARWFQRIYETDNEKYPKALYYWALMQKMSCEYDKAQENFEKYKKLYNEEDLKKAVKNEIDGCILAKKLMANKQDLDIIHLDTTINKAYTESSPLPREDGTLVFSSVRIDSATYFDINNPKPPIRKFYVAKKTGEDWKFRGELPGPFNSEEINTGNGVYSPDGNRFYFTRCEADWQNKIICSIYLSKNDNGLWSEPVKLENGINDPAYTSTMPAIGVESKKNFEVLYFISDRPDGKGGLDLWYSVYDVDKNVFKEPKNAGNKINTEGDEFTPYFDFNTHKLFYSSTGLPGMGGFDIFSTLGELSKWSQPENIGYPINSCADDIYFVPTKDQKYAFLVTNRIGGIALKNPTCCDDIYAAKYNEMFFVTTEGLVFEIKEEKDKIDDNYIKKMIMDSATVSLYLVDEAEKEPIYITRKLTDEFGKYSFDLDRGKTYRMVASKDGYFNKQTDYSTKDATPKTVNIINPLGLLLIPKKPIILDNIYYEFSKATLTATAMQTIDTTIFIILNETPDLIVELSSHTDSVSSDEYNLKLSQKRAESVVDYLISKGIEKNRLVAKGYGETRPIERNTNPDGSDNEAGRQMNRRTEFKVIGSANQFSILNKQDMKVTPAIKE